MATFGRFCQILADFYGFWVVEIDLGAKMAGGTATLVPLGRPNAPESTHSEPNEGLGGGQMHQNRPTVTQMKVLGVAKVA